MRTINQKLNTQDTQAKYDWDVDTRAELQQAIDNGEVIPHSRAFIIAEKMYVIVDGNKQIVDLYEVGA